MRFYALADALFTDIEDDETLCLVWSGEASDFIRLNHNRIRQAGSVRQAGLQIDLINGMRHATASYELSGDHKRDAMQLTQLIAQLREQLPFLPEDPHLLLPDRPRNSADQDKDVGENALPATEELADTLMQASAGMDLVGLIANGSLQRGYANSLGQRNWHSDHHFNLDWSCYAAGSQAESHEAPRQPQPAVKADYAGKQLDKAQLERQCHGLRQQLELGSRPARTITPGKYRAFLAPAALRELLDMMSWGGFGYKSQQTGESPLLKLFKGEARLHNSVTIHEDTASGNAPPFSNSGFIKPPCVTLIKDGAYHQSLVGPRSAREYGLPVTGSEHPESLRMEGGTLDTGAVLRELHSGLYINQLWYCNFSNRAECQITGMTRFACFWVENGELQAPVEAMRFDDSIYRILGSELLGLTRETSTLIDSSSYGERSTTSYQLPGALIRGLRFTL